MHAVHPEVILRVDEHDRKLRGPAEGENGGDDDATGRGDTYGGNKFKESGPATNLQQKEEDKNKAGNMRDCSSHLTTVDLLQSILWCMP